VYLVSENQDWNNEQAPQGDTQPTEQLPVEQSPAVPQQPPASWPSTYPAPAEGAVVPAQPVTYARTSTNAVVALVLAIGSWVGWALCPIIGPLALAIVALVLGSNALKEIRAGQGQITGEGLVTAARIVAWISIGVTVAAAVLGLFFLALALVAGAWDQSSTL
jgi:hypothetical protein